MNDKQKLFNQSIEENNITLFKTLLKDSEVDPAYWGNDAIIKASEYNHINIFKILLNDNRVDPSSDHSWAAKIALKNNNLLILDILMKDERVLNKFSQFQIKSIKNFLLQSFINKVSNF